jgi:hypothetical protein
VGPVSREQPVAEAGAVPSAAPAEATANGDSPAAGDGHPTVVDLPRYRTLRITFRRSGSLDSDRRRLAELVDVLGRYAGEDRFEIVVEAAGIARYQLDFPNNRTSLCPQLERDLTERVGPSNWRTD